MYIKASTICHTSYANHSANNNTLLTLTPGTANPVLVATIDIPPNTELLLDYSGWLPLPQRTTPQSTSCLYRPLPPPFHAPYTPLQLPPPSAVSHSTLPTWITPDTPIPSLPTYPSDPHSFITRRVAHYIANKHNPVGFYLGTVISYTPEHRYWTIVYDDGDDGDYSWAELHDRILRPEASIGAPSPPPLTPRHPPRRTKQRPSRKRKQPSNTNPPLTPTPNQTSPSDHTRRRSRRLNPPPPDLAITQTTNPHHPPHPAPPHTSPLKRKQPHDPCPHPSSPPLKRQHNRGSTKRKQASPPPSPPSSKRTSTHPSPAQTPSPPHSPHTQLLPRKGDG